MHLQPSLQVVRSNSPNQNHQLETTRSTPIINSRLFEDERVSDSLIPILQIVVPHSDESTTNTSSTNGHSKNTEKPAIPSRYSLTRVSSFTNRSFKDLKEVPTDLLPKIIEVSSRSPTPVSPVSPISPPRSYASSPIPSGNTLLPSPITRPAFTRTSSSSTNLSLSNSVPSTLIPKTQKPPNTFLTEVDDKKEIQIEIEDIDFRLDLLPHWLFDSSQQSIEQCKFPKDFATTCKFPRKKPLHPSFVIKQVLNLYFPSLESLYGIK